MDKLAESLEKEYIREFLRPGGSDEEKLAQLNAKYNNLPEPQFNDEDINDD